MPVLASLIQSSEQPPTYTNSVTLAANVAEFFDVPQDQNGKYAQWVRFGKPSAGDFFARAYTTEQAADRAVGGSMTTYITNGTFTTDTGWTKGTGWTITGGTAVSDGSQTPSASVLSQTTALTLLPGVTYTLAYTMAFSEHTTNGTFASDTAWTKGAGWAIAAGVAAATVSSAALEQDSAITLVAGRSYVVVFTVSGFAAGTVTASIGGTAGTARSSDATFTQTIVAGATQVIAFTGAGFTGNIDNVSVKAVGTITPSLGGTAGTAIDTAGTAQQAIIAGTATSTTQIVQFSADEDFVGTLDNVSMVAWVLGTGWTIGSGVISAAGAIDTDASQTAYYPLISGESYLVTFTITAFTAGTIAASLGGGVAGTARGSAATFSEVLVAGATQAILFDTTGFTGSIDNVSVLPSAKVGIDNTNGMSAVQNPTGFLLNGTHTKISVASAGTPTISAAYYR